MRVALALLCRHIPCYYDPQTDSARCLCGAYVITAVESAATKRWRWLFRHDLVLKLALLCVLFAAVAEAGPISVSHSGCVTEAADFSWVGADFLFMAFHSPEQGCAPTIENPTRGLFIESTNPDGLFRVDVPGFLLRGGCGRYQFDAHVRVPGGLSEAPGGLQTLVYDTGRDCAPSRYVPRESESPVSVPDSGSSLLLGGLSVMLVRAATIRESFARLTYAAKTETL